jgi:hypothetical protein
MVLLRWEAKMTRETIIQGTTVEEKLTSIERYLFHMQKRMHKTITVATPSIPFSIYSQGVVVGNVLGAFLFPVACSISKLVAFVESPLFKRGVISVTIVSGLERHEHSYTIGLGRTLIDFDFTVKAEDRVVFKLTAADFGKVDNPTITPTSVDTMWLSFLCSTDISNMKKEEILLDAVLKSTEIAEA